MKRFKAFTLIEVMISIFVFSSAMLGFMAFHAHTMSVMLENELNQFGHALAFNLLDEINAAPNDLFIKLERTYQWAPDKDLATAQFFGEDFKASPFNSFGIQTTSTENYRFYRFFQVRKYSEVTKIYVQNGTHLSTLYQVEVGVFWPKRENPDYDCSSRDTTHCESVIVPLVRSDK